MTTDRVVLDNVYDGDSRITYTRDDDIIFLARALESSEL